MIEHIISVTGAHYLRVKQTSESSSVARYRSIAKLKYQGVWYVGVTDYTGKGERVLNTRDNIDEIMEII